MRVLNKITFEAKDDADALRLAGERLGKDAVILSTRPVRVGGFLGFFQRHTLEVSAGILQDERKEEKNREKDRDDATAKERLVAFQKLIEFKQAAETKEIARPENARLENGRLQDSRLPDGTAKVIYSPTSVVNAVNKPPQDFDSVQISSAGLASAAAPAARPAPADNGGLNPLTLKEEVGDLSKKLDMLMKQIDSMASGAAIGDAAPAPVKDKNFKEGLPQLSVGPFEPDSEGEGLYKRLIAEEVDADYARQLVEEYGSGEKDIPFVKLLESKVNCVSNPSSVLGGRKVMLLGPTGVGKTTTIAKLAAIQALWEHKNVLLLTSDTYRIAAVDQLRTYAKILGIPIEVVFEVENFAHILDDHADSDLILLDTAGRGQRDKKNLETLEIIYNTFKPDAVHLVLAANMKYRDMIDVVERMSVIPVSHLIFTKLDETVTYGALFNILKSLDCPVSYFTTGQNVPNDIEAASGARLVSLLMGEGLRGGAQ